MAIRSTLPLIACLLLAICEQSNCIANPPEIISIVAIERLGHANPNSNPHAQQTLLQVLLEDPRDNCRLAAISALTKLLERDRPPANPTHGWRRVPDPEICTQLQRVFDGQAPLSSKALYSCYSLRQHIYFERRNQRRGITPCECDPELIQALAQVAFGRDLIGNWCEVDPEIRWRAAQALTVCCNEASIDQLRRGYENPAPEMMVPLLADNALKPDQQGLPETRSPKPIDDAAPSEEKNGSPDRGPTTAPGNDATPFVPPSASSLAENSSTALGDATTGSDLAVLDSGFQLNYAGDVPLLGRADFSNRFNIFDNMSAAPRTRVWSGFQYVQTQNNGVVLTADSEKLFSVLNTASGRAEFISLTGFGRQPTSPPINPFDPRSKEALKAQFLQANGGRTQNYLLSPDTDLFRFGLEYAMTTDFSVSFMTQYVHPLEDNEQPDSFSNPSLQFKHVLYRETDTILSGIFNLQPQIPSPKYSITEGTTRYGFGLISYQKLTDTAFAQGVVSLSLPVETRYISTIDYGLGFGKWAYKHESLEPYYRGHKPDKWLLGFVPQFEVLGKSVLGDNQIVGTFDLKGTPPQTAPGTVSPVDGSRNIYFPQDFKLFQQSSFIYQESRHNVDLTLGATLIFRDNIVYSAAFSAPVTGGNSRALEFLTSLNKYF